MVIFFVADSLTCATYIKYVSAFDRLRLENYSSKQKLNLEYIL